jgi:hypothetical protein
MAERTQPGNSFHLVLIKPTHHDDDGYPIQWFRSAIPSNALACLNGLAEDATRRKVLGAEVRIALHTYDETNRRVRPDRIIRMLRRTGERALIGLVGVQTNQFPRAIDLARPFLATGLPVCLGGFSASTTKRAAARRHWRGNSETRRVARKWRRSLELARACRKLSPPAGFR